jgi:hypothetical protein
VIHSYVVSSFHGEHRKSPWGRSWVRRQWPRHPAEETRYGAGRSQDGVGRARHYSVNERDARCRQAAADSMPPHHRRQRSCIYWIKGSECSERSSVLSIPYILALHLHLSLFCASMRDYTIHPGVIIRFTKGGPKTGHISLLFVKRNPLGWPGCSKTPPEVADRNAKPRRCRLPRLPPPRTPLPPPHPMKRRQ